MTCAEQITRLDRRKEGEARARLPGAGSPAESALGDPCARAETTGGACAAGLRTAGGSWGHEDLDELEERLETEYALDFVPMLCVWYTCPDVCPPGG